VIKWLTDLPNKLFRVVAEHVITNWLRDAANGDHGRIIQWILLFIKGKKTAVGFLLGLVGFVGGNVFDPQVLWWCQRIGILLFGVGLIDKAVWTPGRPQWLQDWWLYRLLADHAGFISSTLISAFTMVYGSSCAAWVIHQYSVSCSTRATALLCLTFFFIWVGVLDVGFLTSIPRPGRPFRPSDVRGMSDQEH